MKSKLAMFDMDGTLYDTRAVNFYSYKKALEIMGISIEFEWFLSNCYGRYYKDFLKPVTDEIEKVHELKKSFYGEFLNTAVENTHLFNIINSIRDDYYTALVTTASRKNTMELLRCFDREDCFDIIITQEDVKKNKPDPEAYIYTMEHFNIAPQDSIIFEDSKTGVAAAKASGANLYIVKGYA